LVDQYDGEVMWVYRHFPLDSIHPSARPAAEASECVAQLAGNDAFWAFADAIFSKAALSDEVILEVANSLGADITDCLARGEVTDLVDADLNSGLSAGIQGTPGNVLINLETEETSFIPGALPIAQLSEAVDSLL
jgi:protein-disulfide isomerase